MNRRKVLRNCAEASGGLLFASCCGVKAAMRPVQSATPVKRRQVMVGGRRTLTVDVHSHCIIDIRDLVKDHEEGRSDTLLDPRP